MQTPSLISLVISPWKTPTSNAHEFVGWARHAWAWAALRMFVREEGAILMSLVKETVLLSPRDTYPLIQ